MAAANIDQFNELTGAVFAKLYSVFPIKTDLDVMDFLGVLDLASDSEDADAAFEFREFFYSTVDWLINTGFVSSTQSTMDMSHFYMCTLTAKGLEALKAVPESIGGETLGGKLAEAAKEGATSQLKELGSLVISKGFGFVSSAAATWMAGQ